MSNPITLPTLAEGASLKLTDPRPSADADFITKKGRPVDAVCVDSAIIETGKGTPAVRLLFVVVDGQDHADQSVKGRNIITDKYLTPGGAPYTFADLRLMGWKVEDGKEIEAAGALADGAAAAGLNNKIVRIDLKEESFNGATTVRVAGISQPPQKLDTAAAKTRLAGLADMIKASKEGRPASAGKGGTAAIAPRNGTSAPPAVQQGSIAPDTEMPF